MPDPRDLHLLSVGISDYAAESGLPAAKYAEADATELAREFERQCGFSATVLLGRDATRQAIDQAILDIGRRSGKTFVFAFCGHSQYIHGQYTLHPYDSRASGVSGLSFESLTRHWQHDFGYDQVLAILDACRNEGAARGGGVFSEPAKRDIEKALGQGAKRVEVLYGCTLGQCCWGYDELKHGLLTAAILNVMRNYPAEQVLHFGALADHAADWMEESEVRKKYGSGREQVPYLYSPPSAKRKAVLRAAKAPIAKLAQPVGTDRPQGWQATQQPPVLPPGGVPAPAESIGLANDERRVTDESPSSKSVWGRLINALALPGTPKATLKRYGRIVQQVNAMESMVQDMPDETLRDRSQELHRGLVDRRLLSADVLPEAFAIIRESMDRHVGIRNTLNPDDHFDPDVLDDEMLEEYDLVQRRTIAEGLSWRQVPIPTKLYKEIRRLYPDSRPPYRARCSDSQLLDGLVLYEAKNAEMATGEGKAFVGALAYFMKMLERIDTHGVTPNSYLASDDFRWALPALEHLGFNVGVKVGVYSGGSTAEPPIAFVGVKVGRNDLCPCGSGRKYKKCCGIGASA